MTGRRARRAAYCGDDVEIAAVAQDFRTLGREAFNDPVFRILPGVVTWSSSVLRGQHACSVSGILRMPLTNT